MFYNLSFMKKLLPIKMIKIYSMFIVLLAGYQSSLQAAPMSFKGSITSMTTISTDYSSVESGYAISSKDSIFVSNKTKIRSEGFNITQGGSIIEFYGKTSLTSSK